MKKKEPIYTLDLKVEEKDYRIELKKPTRSMLNDAEMYYAVQFNRYIKMGLLTSEQYAKKQIDSGGIFTEEQQKKYVELQTLLTQKEEMLIRVIAKGEGISDNENERKENLIVDISILRNQISDYEYVRNSAYDQTANSKARNDVIFWWCLALPQLAEIKESDTPVFAAMFKGDDFETRKSAFEELEDEEAPILTSSFEKIVRIITAWYWMGITNKDDIKKIVEEKVD
jgi:hypothetical protein